MNDKTPQEFLRRLQELLAEFKAEINITNRGSGYDRDDNIDVDFDSIYSIYDDDANCLRPYACIEFGRNVSSDSTPKRIAT